MKTIVLLRIADLRLRIFDCGLERLKMDLTWQLTCREDTGKKPLVKQSIEFSDFPLDYIKIWVIDKVALLPSEY